MTRLLAVVIASCLVGLAVASGAALAAQPRASLPDIEDEVMCVECGTPLNLSNAAVAERERAFIRREIARGRTKQQIKDGLVDRFGPEVLALPEEKGFGLTAYLVPVLAVLAALVAVAAAALRWRRPARAPQRLPELDPADARRLERELAAYDAPGGASRAPPAAKPPER